MIKINVKNTVKTLFALAAATLINNTNLMDASKNWDMDFQDPASPVMEGIINFHNDLMVLMTLVLAFVTYFIYVTVYNLIQCHYSLNFFPYHHNYPFLFCHHF